MHRQKRTQQGEALCAGALFRGIALDRRRVRLCSFERGEVVSDERWQQRFVCLIIEGVVDAYNIAGEGNEVLVNTLGPDDAFGISNLFGAANLPTLLRAREAGSMLLIPKDYVIEIMRDNPSFAERYARLCNEKIQFLLGRMAQLMGASTRVRLLEYLKAHAQADGTVRVEMSRQSLADYLGVSRASLYRELSTLRREGDIKTVSRGVIRIVRPWPRGREF